MPFGSVTERAQLPLVVGALAICAAAAFARAVIPSVSEGPGGLGGATPIRPGPSLTLGVTRAFRLWTAGGFLFAVVVALQLLPLPNPLLGALSPESLRLWSAAERVASLAGVATPEGSHPLSIDPQTTTVHLFRLLAYIATFLAAALLMRRHRHRIALAFVLGATAVFETLYGIREAALQRYAIWGWVNKLIFNRVTGTFVNPNHFAHYAAIVLPLGVYLAAQEWHDAAPSGVPWRRRIVRLFEKRFLRFVFGVIVAFACIVAILVAQSRGGLVAAVAGFAIVGAIASGRRHALWRGLLIGVAGVAFAIVLALLLGLKVSRFQDPEVASLGGRAIPLKAAFDLWRRFPLFGTGLGTFADVSSMTGVAGYVALVRMTFGARAAELSWTRRAYQAAALTSLAIAAVHALIDFNFFIPANPATLAAIAGTAVAIRDSR